MKRNSVKQIEEYLKLTVCASENKIMRDVFGYDRNNTRESNKKYAEMLRRGLEKGLYKRFESKFNGVKPRIFYYIGTDLQFEMMIEYNHAEFFDFIMKNEGIGSKK
jgi:hypothetical protein